jgi:flagellar biosynthetic protein FliR
LINLFGLHTAELETFFLIWVRCSTMVMIMPIFGTSSIPGLVRVALGLVISFAVAGTVHPLRVPLDFDGFAVGILCQAIIGVLFGFVTQLIFMGIQFAGEILDVQIGFAVANILNPTTQQQVTIIGELELAITTLIFLVTNSHLLYFQGMAGSFSLLPLPWAEISQGTQDSIALFFTQALLIIFKIAAPASITLFLVNVTLAFMARVAPQMNIFVVGFPIQISVGLIMLIICLPLMGYALPDLFSQVPRQIDTLMRSLAPA